MTASVYTLSLYYVYLHISIVITKAILVVVIYLIFHYRHSTWCYNNTGISKISFIVIDILICHTVLVLVVTHHLLHYASLVLYT